MLASIVTVCYGKPQLTERMLASLEAALGPELGRSIELVLVDNASPDGGETAALLRRWETRATVIHEPENRNYAGGNNDGARAARGDVLLFLNNDVEVGAGVLEALVAEALAPDVGAVGARLLYPDGTIQHGGVVWRRDRDGAVHAFHLFAHETGALPAARVSYDLDVVTGACFAIRRELFTRLGGFDEAYVNGYEDVDLCLRLRSEGFRIRYRGDVELLHDESATRGRGWDMAHNDAVLRERWGGLLDADDDLLADLLDARVDEDRMAWYPAPSPFGSQLAIVGEVSGLSPAAAEARAFVHALTPTRFAPSARDWHETFVVPRLHDDERVPLLKARLRPTRPGALQLHVPAPRSKPTPGGPATIARLGAPLASLPEVGQIWAASVDVADALVRLGVDASLVEVVPPVVPPAPLGDGGAGILVLAPAHDAAATARVCAEAAATGLRVRIVPTVAGVLDEVVAAAAPGSELLSPAASERTLAALAGEADVVVCADDSDPFQRRALVAAAAGAVPVAATGGPAADVLGDRLAGDVADALERIDGRSGRAAAVAAACAPESLAPSLVSLLESLERSARRPLLRGAA